MLVKAKMMKNYKLASLDGEIGKSKDFYFDDRFWTIRYLVAETGNWLTGRTVLISPYALKGVDTFGETVAVNLTKARIKGSPSLDSDKPVSRQFEFDYYGYYGWPGYWGGPYSWGAYPYFRPNVEKPTSSNDPRDEWNPNLRSINTVDGYHVQAGDGQIGHIEDFIIDDKNWAIRYLIIDTHNWLPGKRFLISPQWIDDISWSEGKVFANLSRETIKESPEYLTDASLTRDYETRLHQHYDRKGYWVEEPTAETVLV
jgi:hypothetical protein